MKRGISDESQEEQHYDLILFQCSKRPAICFKHIIFSLFQIDMQNIYTIGLE